jgi:hypothetical protein
MVSGDDSIKFSIKLFLFSITLEHARIAILWRLCIMNFLVAEDISGIDIDDCLQCLRIILWQDQRPLIL